MSWHAPVRGATAEQHLCEAEAYLPPFPFSGACRTTSLNEASR